MYNWSRNLPECNLRKAINNVLCSACHISSTGFKCIQEWIGIVAADGSNIIAPSTEEIVAVESNDSRMTDDSKEATRRPAAPGASYSTVGMTDDSKEVWAFMEKIVE